MLPWLNSVIEARLPRDASALNASPTLREIKLADSWLGDWTHVEGVWPRLRYAEYRATKLAPPGFPTAPSR